MAGEDAYRWGKREPITAEALTRRFLALHLRAQAMEALRFTEEEVMRTVSDRVLQRSEDVIAGLRGQLAQIIQLEWLTALSTSPLNLAEGETRALVVLADQRALFAPGPYAILTRTSTPDDYAIIRTLHYDRTLGQLDFEVVTRVGRPGPFADWQVAALAGSTLAQMSLLGVGKAARDLAVAARDRAETAAGAADADAAATALDRIQTGLDRIATGNDRAATLILRNQAVEAAGSVDTSKFLQLDGLRPLTGKLQLAASASGRAAFNLPAGTDPSAPAEGDAWNAGGTLKALLGSVTRVFAFLGLTQTWTARQTFAVPLNLAPGGTAAAPADGDLRIAGTGVFARYGGAEVQLADAAAVAAAIGGKADRASTPTIDDFRTALIQIAKLKGSTVGMAAGVADDFRDTTGVAVVYTEASQSLPAMTGPSAPTGHVASSSSRYQANGENSGSYGSFNAFDGSTPTASNGGTASWYSDSQSAPWWLQRQVPVAIMVGAYSVIPRDDAAVPNSWDLLGSNDGSTWTTLDSRSGIVWSAASWVPQKFTIAAPGSFKYYRLNIKTANGGFASGYVSIAEMQLFQRFPNGAGDSVNATYDQPNNLITNLVSGSPAALDLRSIAFTAAAQPAKGSLFALVKATAGTITANTNLLADISRDGGTTWTTGTLVAAGSYGGFTMYEANGFDISGQPAGTSMKWRLRTVGTALAVAVDAVVAQWG